MPGSSVTGRPAPAAGRRPRRAARRPPRGGGRREARGRPPLRDGRGRAGDRLDRVRDRVAQVQDGPEHRVALVRGDGSVLGPRASKRAGPARHAQGPAPGPSSGLAPTARHRGSGPSSRPPRTRPPSPRPQGARRHRVRDEPVTGRTHRRGLRLGQVDAGLPTVGRVDLRHQRRGDLDHGNPALVGRRTEAREIADDPTTDREDEVVSASTRPRQLAKHALGLGTLLLRLAAVDGVRRLGAGPRPGIEPHDLASATRNARSGTSPVGCTYSVEAPGRTAATNAGQSPTRTPPGHPQPGLGPRRAIQGAAAPAARAPQRAGRGAPRARRGGGARRRGARTFAVARERPLAVAARALPRGRLVDVAPDDQVVHEGLADPLAAERAAAQHDDTPPERPSRARTACSSRSRKRASASLSKTSATVLPATASTAASESRASSPSLAAITFARRSCRPP